MRWQRQLLLPSVLDHVARNFEFAGDIPLLVHEEMDEVSTSFDEVRK